MLLCLSLEKCVPGEVTLVEHVCDPSGTCLCPLRTRSMPMIPGGLCP